MRLLRGRAGSARSSQATQLEILARLTQHQKPLLQGIAQERSHGKAGAGVRHLVGWKRLPYRVQNGIQESIAARLVIPAETLIELAYPSVVNMDGTVWPGGVDAAHMIIPPYRIQFQEPPAGAASARSRLCRRMAHEQPAHLVVANLREVAVVNADCVEGLGHFEANQVIHLR